MEKILLLAEHDYQVKDFLDRGLKNEGEWIALGPSAMYYLDQMKISYTIPEDYCSLNEIETVCEEQFDKLRHACEEIDSVLIEKDSFLKEWNIRPFFFNLWQLSVLMDTLISRVVWLRKIMENYAGYHIYAHLQNTDLMTSQINNSNSLFFDKHETLWGKLLSLEGWQNPIYLLPEPAFQNKVGFLRSKYLNRLKLILTNSSLIYNFILFKRYKLPLRKFVASILFNKKSPHVFIPKHPFQWRYVFPSLFKSGIEILFHRFDFPISYAKVNQNGKAIELCNSFLRAVRLKEGTDYPSLIKDRIIWIIENSRNIAKKIIKTLERLNNKYNLCAVLNSITFDYSAYVVKQYFIGQNIPVVCYQHGSVWYDKKITQKVDLHDMVSTTVLLTYGDAVSQAYSQSDLKNHPEIISTGSIGLDNLSVFKKTSRYVTNELKILYVITGYNKNAWYCGFSPPMSDRIYYREQFTIINGLIEIVQNYSYISVTIKLHPSNYKGIGDDPPWIDNLLKKRNIYLKRYPSFSEMINNYDIIIIDSPTTTLLEALTSKAPIFVLTSIISPPRRHISLLKKRAVCCYNAEDLIDKINNYLKSKSYPADVNNREFLELYGTFRNDGKSKERVIQVVNKLIKEHIVEE